MWRTGQQLRKDLRTARIECGPHRELGNRLTAEDELIDTNMLEVRQVIFIANLHNRVHMVIVAFDGCGDEQGFAIDEGRVSNSVLELRHFIRKDEHRSCLRRIRHFECRHELRVAQDIMDSVMLNRRFFQCIYKYNLDERV
ncbi:hypothetical protein D3C86_1613290 [compost metagenome]